MKLILNRCYGGFSISPEVFRSLGLGLSAYSRFDTKLRYLPELIKMVENGEDVGDDYTDLHVVNIPDEVTDYKIIEYDGLEYVIYVLNGKLHEIY